VNKSENVNSKGIFYGTGVGPGDPELMTLKAVRLIMENEIIAVPGRTAGESAAYRIAASAVPEIKNKTVIPLEMPMVHDTEKMKAYHRKAADTAEKYLNSGKNVVFLTLGDPSVYSTCSYLEQIIKEDGFETVMTSGITSFCAASAAAGIPLTGWNQSLHIYPASQLASEVTLNDNDTYIFMKSGRKMKEMKDFLQKNNARVTMVENCGMENERIFRSVSDISDDSGYFSLIIADKRNST